MAEEKSILDDGPDDSLDFTVILTNPVQAATQTWTVGDAIDPRTRSIRSPAGSVPARAAGINDQFLIGRTPIAGVADAICRVGPCGKYPKPSREAPILVVDDDLITRKILERLLKNDGYGVRTAGNKGEFLGAINAKPAPSLIMLDISMPDMDGFVVLGHLKKHALGMNVPVVFLTSHTGEVDVERAFSLGAAGYLSKPVTVGAVRSTVRKIFAR